MTNWAENPAVYLNGKLMRASEARISPFDHGFLFGDGVFETVRAYGGQVFESSAHFERLATSAEVADIALPFEKSGWDALLDEVVRANGIDDAVLRVTVTRGVGQAVVGHAETEPTVLVAPRPVPPRGPADWERGITCAMVDVRTRSHDHLNPEIKCLSYMSNVLALRQARERGADEAIMLTGNGFVAEGSVSNVFGVWDGVLITPPEGEILPGVTRAVVLEQARAGNIPVKEEPLPAGRLVGADEMFITGTGWEVMPVTFLDGNQIGDGRPGPVTRSLYAAYCRRIASEHGVEHWSAEWDM